LSIAHRAFNLAALELQANSVLSVNKFLIAKRLFCLNNYPINLRS